MFFRNHQKIKMKIKIPSFSLVLLMGASSSGKSTFARNNFKSTEIISSDTSRSLVDDDENNQDASKDAFELMHFLTEKRLKRGKLTVIDATNVQKENRAKFLEIAKKYNCHTTIISFDIEEEIIKKRHDLRKDRFFGYDVLYLHRNDFKKSIKSIGNEGFNQIYLLKSPQDVEQVEIILFNDEEQKQA
jgi:protein phosphatase